MRVRLRTALPKVTDPGAPAHVSRRGDDGFTLIELIIVVAIMPIVVGSLFLAVFVFTNLASSASDRVGASTDSQITSSIFYKDVQSASQFTTSVNPIVASPGSCGSGTRLIAFTFGNSPVEVSYNLSSLGATTQFGIQEYQLTRYQCSIPSLSVLDTTVLSARAAGAPAATITVSGRSCLQSTPSSCYYGIWGEDWVPTTGVTSIVLSIDEAATNPNSLDTNGNTCTVTGMTYCFSVQAVPRDWSLIQGASGQLTGPTVPAQFLGSNNDINACNSNNPFMAVNGALLLDSLDGSNSVTGSNKSNIYGSPVQYVGSNTPNSPPIGTGVPTQSIPLAIPDPLAGLATPDFSGLPTYSSMTSAVAKTVTSGGTTYEFVSPGTYSIPLAPVSSGDTVVLLSGEYDLVGGIGVGNIESGPGGTMLYVPGNASVTSNTGLNLTLSPLTSGPYSGLSLWVPNESITLGPNTNEINGVVYVPNGTYGTDGNSSTWIGTLLANGLLCNGGGSSNGQFNIGYSQTVSITSTPPTSIVDGVTHYVVTASDSAVADLTGTQPTLTPVLTLDPLSTAGACSITPTTVTSTTTSSATVTFNGPGECLVDANQPGTSLNGNSTPPTGGYTAAPTVQQFILVPPAG